MRCIRPFDSIRWRSCASNLLADLTADFAARIGRGVDVDIVLAGHQIGGLGVGQRRAAFGGARGSVRDPHPNARVLGGFTPAMEIRAGPRTPEPRIVYPPPHPLLPPLTTPTPRP